MTRQPDERPSKSSVQGSRSEWRDTSYFHGAVERLVVIAEAFVMGAIPRLVDVEQRHDKPRPVVITPDAARGLDVLGVGLGLAQNDHQPEARDVESHRDHVGRDGAVDTLLLVLKPTLESS